MRWVLMLVGPIGGCLPPVKSNPESGTWLAKRAQAAAAVEAAEDAAADQPPLIARFLMASADATNGFGIDDVSVALNAVARGQEPRRLFPRFEAPVPMVWERARGMLEAVKSGSDATAAFFEPPKVAAVMKS